MYIVIALNLILFLAFPAHASDALSTSVNWFARFPVIAEKPAVVRTATTPAPEITAASAGVWDPVTNDYLFGKAIDDAHPIASVSKLMTALVVIDHGVNLGTEVTMTAEENAIEGSRISLPTGARVTVKDVLAGTLVASANNAALALAHAAGSEAEVIALMNQRAHDLGLTSTHFSDVTGLSTENRSSVRDLTRLASVAFAQKAIADMTTTETYDITNKTTNEHLRIANTNKLLGSGLNIVGGKTGYTEAANGALLMRIRGNGGHEVIVAVLESANRETRFSDVRALADWTFATHAWRMP